MSTEPLTPAVSTAPAYVSADSSERGLLVAVLLMVLLGVGAMLLIS